MLICTVALFGLTPLYLVHVFKKLKTSYNSSLRNLLLIKELYSASTMFVTHLYSFYELLRTSIYRFADRVSKNSYSIIMTCMTYIHFPIQQWWRSVLY